MPMKLEGSCQCGGVEFTLQSHTPIPYALCACSICRKVGGYMGSVNLGGIAESLNITKGKELIKYVVIKSKPTLICSDGYNFTAYGHANLFIKTRKYNAIKNRGQPGKEESRCSSERNFCSNCSAMLWLWDRQWPELIHPFASAIDTELPVPEEMVCVLADSKVPWARWPEGKKVVYEGYPEESLEGYHKKNGGWVE
ncbi:hypothetical protein FQN55_005961 [Onygenales sp. PD_40]|nr:hypothetical protein FQN55_005961 [Onygenales sp. PD_40]